MAFFRLCSFLLFTLLATINTAQSKIITASPSFDYKWSVTNLTATTLDIPNGSGTVTTYAFTFTDGLASPPAVINCNATFNGFPQSVTDNFPCATNPRFGFRFTWFYSEGFPPLSYVMLHIMHTVEDSGFPQIRSGDALLASSAASNSLYACNHFGGSTVNTVCNKPGQSPIIMSDYTNGLAPDGWQGDPVTTSKRAMRRGLRKPIIASRSLG